MITYRRSVCVACIAAAVLLLGMAQARAQEKDTPAAAPSAKSTTEAADKANLRAIRVAVFDFDVLKGVDLEPAALTDQINTMLDEMLNVTIVNRDQIKRVADEHKMVLAGLVDNASAAQLGKFLSANYVIVGRASRIGQTNYLVLKIVDVATTVQTTVSAKTVAEKGLEALVERLKDSLAPQVRELQKPLEAEDDAALAKVREAAKALIGKVILVDVTETHVNRPLVDPAAQMAVANRLKALGIEVIVPKDPVAGWKQALLETGRYGEQKVDFVLEGEGTSAYAAAMEGLISCRARVELRLIAVPGRTVTVSDKGVAARVDLVDALAAKAALEDAGVQACDAVITRFAAGQGGQK
ncbi:MAG TPA: CsgG/HfaB family protein [Phycisphaerae bacterium]|nr:CsgG/HfaB family protein [Phycisphaerae bacterium]